MADEPQISLILATAGTARRTAEITRLLESLRAQTFREFEVLVADQNDDFDLSPLLAPFEADLRIVHFRTPRGLSRARNAALARARGPLCGFPDDDCWYPADLLARVAAGFAAPELAGLHGKGADEQGRDMARFDRRAGPISKFNVLERSVSCALFYRTEAVRAVGGFDEDMGLGSGGRWTGCEDYDLPIRLLAQGRRLTYAPDLVVHHPCPTGTYDLAAVRRAAAQSPSYGRLLVLHRYPPRFVATKLIRPLGGVALALLRGDVMRARYHWAGFLGRCRGVAAGFR